jgi:hypothetical protein
VTSRTHFTLPGLVARNLDELPHEDACDLLLKIAPRINGTAGEIARICDRLPFALRLAGGALAERTDLTPDFYLRQLTDENKRSPSPARSATGRERQGPVGTLAWLWGAKVSWVVPRS